MSNTESAVEERALTLLGQGIDPRLVASAVGVTVSRISQLVSDPIFASRVSELRYRHLAKHNERDNRYDALEEQLIERMEGLLPMMYKPMEILKAISVINGATRRGASTPESILEQKETVSLTMPTVVLQQFNTNFVVNVNNQVVKAGDQELVTVQSVRMQDLLKTRNGSALLERNTAGERNNHGHVVSETNQRAAGSSG